MTGDIPDTLLLISCPECPFQRTTGDPKATRVKIGGEKCPNCDHHYGDEAIVMRYESVDRVRDLLNDPQRFTIEHWSPEMKDAVHSAFRRLQVWLERW